MQTPSLQTLVTRPDLGLVEGRDALDSAKRSCDQPTLHLTPNSLAMIIVTRPDTTQEQIDHIVDRIRSWGLKAEVSRGEMRVVIGVIGPE
ncbi:MAG TPA: hypothetical protein VK673_09400, partial [Chthoniobacterales bacterium]|nr:hypothetical protein [Chthoniobacterales bacterium]